MRKFLRALMIPILLAGFASAQSVNVAIPDTSGQVGVQIGIPVQILDDVTGLGILAVEGVITYDPTYLTVEDVSLGSIVPSSWMFAYNTSTPGVINFAMATDTLALEGQGDLLIIQFLPIAEGYSPISFSSFMFNSGTPSAVTTDGSITIASSPSVDVSMPYVNAPVGGSVTVPVQINTDVTGMGILAAEFHITYDPTLVQVDSVKTTPMSENWTLAYNATIPGTLAVAMAGTDPLSGTGELIEIYFTAIGPEGSYTDLIFSDFLFNAGNPVAVLHDGRIYIGAAGVLGLSFSGGYVTPGSSADICINVDSVIQSSQNVLAFEGAIYYNPDVLTPSSYVIGDLIPDGWTVAVNLNAGNGRISFAGAGASPMEGGPGTLLCVTFQVIGGECDTSALTFDYFMWNNGMPPVEWTNGSVISSTAPTAPLLTEPSNGICTSNTTPTFSWEDVVPEGTYHLVVDTDSTFPGPVIDVITSDPTYTPTDALSEGIYYWQVTPFSVCGREGSSSEIWSFSVDLTPPTDVTLVWPENGYITNETSITLLWNSSTDDGCGIDHYVVSFDEDPDFDTPTEWTTTDTSFTIPIVLSDGVYYWRVKAVDAAGNETGWSESRSFEIDTDAPIPPTPLYPIDVYLGTDTVTFQWTEVTFSTGKDGHVSDAPVHYVIQIKDATFQTLIEDTVDETQVTEILPHDVDTFIYFWQVKAYDDAGNQSAYSFPYTFYLDMKPPTIANTTVLTDTTYPGPFTIQTNVSEEAIEAGVDKVYLYFKIGDADWASTEMTNAGGDSYMGIIPGPLGPNTTVKYYIEAYDLANPANVARDPASAPDSTYEFIATGVKESTKPLPKEFALERIFPNPSRGIVNIEFALPKDSKVEIKIYDVAGKKVKTLVSEVVKAGIQTVKWDGRDDTGRRVSMGVYFAVMKAEKYTFRKKFVVTGR
jgi:hypothetical protein